VLIVNNGFEYEGQLFKSLTAVANAITGSHVNGFQFFGLGRGDTIVSFVGRNDPCKP
jgi:hypothetical protein